MVSPTTVLGAAGEHHVMSQLLRHGLVAALAPAGVPNTDIIVSDGIGTRLFAIQVKTRMEKGTDGGWHMSKKHESIEAALLYYVFVDFGLTPTSPARSYIVPSSRVAEVLRVSHQVWLAKPGKGGKPHNDHDMRRFLPSYDHLGSDFGCGSGRLDPYSENWRVFTD